MIKNVDIDQMYAEKKETKNIDQMYAEEKTRPKTKIDKFIEEKRARRRIREKSLDIIEACALATTPETLENDAWQLAHTARTWTEIYINLTAVEPDDLLTTMRTDNNGLL